MAVDKRRLLVLAALACITAAAWAYLLHGAGMTPEMNAMEPMPGMDDPQRIHAGSAWTIGHAGAVFVMWAAMMAAMMLPGAAAAITVRGALFGLAYGAVWIAFGAGATALQWSLERTGTLSAQTALHSASLAALLIAGIGAYQFTPLKRACLRHCRADAGVSDANASTGTALARGLLHGAHCVGCCWALMLLLFVGGVMNVVWMAVLTLFVLAEKALPSRLPLARLAGVALILGGIVVRVHAAP